MKVSTNSIDYMDANEVRILMEGIDEDNNDLYITVTREGIITDLIDKMGGMLGTNCYYLDGLVGACL